jgi:predicted DNA-binding transcriptional regulator YafY
MPTMNDDLNKTLGQLLPREMNAVWLGALLTERLADQENAIAAQNTIAALEAIRDNTIDGTGLEVETAATADLASGKAIAHHLDVHALRQALIHELKLCISYFDAKGRSTTRTVWPLNVEDYGPNGAMLA